MSNNFYECFRYKTCGSEDFSKIAKFWVRTMSHGHRSRDVDDVKRRSRFAQKDHNWCRIMGVWLWHWNQSLIIPMKTSKGPKTEKSTSSAFCSLFSSIAMTWCIMNSCHKVIRPIRNTTLKLCADCANQFVRNAWNCGKTKHESCILTTHNDF